MLQFLLMDAFGIIVPNLHPNPRIILISGTTKIEGNRSRDIDADQRLRMFGKATFRM